MQWVSRTFNLSKDLLSNFFTTSISRRLRPDLSNASEYDKCGNIILKQRFCTRSISLESLLVKPGCHTEHAYSITDLIHCINT